MSLHEEKSLGQIAAETRAGVLRSDVEGDIRLSPQEAGELGDHVGLVRTVAQRAFAMLLRDKVRPENGRELLGIATIVAAKFLEKHDPAKGRFSSFFFRYGPSHVVRAWRILDGGMQARVARGLTTGKGNRVYRARGSEELVGQHVPDRSGSPLDTLIAREERAEHLRVVAELQQETDVDLVDMRARGVSLRMLGELHGMSHEAIRLRAAKVIARLGGRP